MISTEKLDLSYQVVEMGEMATGTESKGVLGTRFLGAGLAVAVFDPETKIGGLLHAVLPNSQLDPQKALRHPGTFMDTGVRALMEAVRQQGADQSRLRIVAAGGADILAGPDGYAIGSQNHRSMLKILKNLGLQLEIAHVGGRDNRCLMLNLSSGEAWVKISGYQKSVFLWKNSTST